MEEPVLVRQGAIYHFRRRVPNDLRAILQKGELWYSLRTSDTAQVDAAKARAAAAESRLSEVQFAAAAVGLEEAALADTKATLARSMTVLTDLKARYEEAHTGRRTAESIAKGLVDALGRGIGAPPVPKESPVFTALQQKFLAAKSETTKDHDG